MSEWDGFDDARDDRPDAGHDAAGCGSGPPRYLTGEEDAAVVRAVEAVVERYRSPDFAIALAGTPACRSFTTCVDVTS